MAKITKLQKLRSSLMIALESVESGTFDQEKVNNIVNISDCVTKTYNTEIRAKELEVNAQGLEINIGDLDVFETM